MDTNPRIVEKRSKLAKLISATIQNVVTISNIKVGFKLTWIWPLNYDVLLNDMACIQAFDIHDKENVDALVNMLSLSQTD